ncbi:hypothetical protein Stok01_00092 [Sulfurisphaera tokodaii]
MISPGGSLHKSVKDAVIINRKLKGGKNILLYSLSLG